jgi:hypothetical protein
VRTGEGGIALAKVSKEQQWRMEGFSYAISKLQGGATLEDLVSEAKMRGAYGIPINISRAELNRFEEKVKTNVVRTVLLMSCNTLQDEFDFGKKRIKRFMDRFQMKSSAMKQGYIDLVDISKHMAKELNIQFEFLD